MNKLREFLAAKFTAKQNNTIANVVMFAGVMINTIEILNNPTTWNWGVNLTAIALVVIGGVYQAMFVRCPHCGDKLKGLKNKLPDRCPNCGGALDKLPQK